MKTTSCTTVPRISVARPAPVTGSWLAGILRLAGVVFASMAHWRERAKQRRQLSELDDRLLTDVGLSRSDAWQESRKHFWQA